MTQTENHRKCVLFFTYEKMWSIKIHNNKSADIWIWFVFLHRTDKIRKTSQICEELYLRILSE